MAVAKPFPDMMEERFFLPVTIVTVPLPLPLPLPLPVVVVVVVVVLVAEILLLPVVAPTALTPAAPEPVAAVTAVAAAAVLPPMDAAIVAAENDVDGSAAAACILPLVATAATVVGEKQLCWKRVLRCLGTLLLLLLLVLTAFEAADVVAGDVVKQLSLRLVSLPWSMCIRSRL